MFRPDQITVLAFTGTSAATSVTFAKGAKLALMSSAACWILTGSAPTAAANTGLFVPAGIAVTITIGDAATKIAAIQASGAGTLCIGVM